MTVTYSKALPNIHKITQENMKLLHKSKEMKKIFPNPPLIAYKRDKNLKDILVHHKHNKQFYPEKQGSFKCQNNCKLCEIMIESKEFKSKDNISYKINQEINCHTKNVIYGITCDKCEQIVYVGETKTELYTRIQNHLSTVRHNKDEPVPNHFNTEGHTIDNFKMIGIEKIKQDNTDMRRIRESFWIKKLKTTIPEGLNRNN